MAVDGIGPSAPLLLAAVVLDAGLGDPDVWYHPMRVLGRMLMIFESGLRRVGADGYLGGCILFVALATVAAGGPGLLLAAGLPRAPAVRVVAHVLLLYTCLAQRDLVDHVRRVEQAAARQDLTRARRSVGQLVGRDDSRMDLAACRRAAIESLSENFVDGFLSVLFWYLLLGIPGALAFKVVSTMDSMIGYKTPRYVRFGWCGARLDDAMNYIPARISWILLSLTAVPFSDLSAINGLRVGFRQHGMLPSPNSGWSEAAMAGILRRRLVGPIWVQATLVTDRWIGRPEDPEAGKREDIERAIRAVIAAGAAATVMSTLILCWID